MFLRLCPLISIHHRFPPLINTDFEPKALILVLGLWTGLLTGCGPSDTQTKATPYQATAMGYVKTPEITSVAVTVPGDLLVTGTAFAEGRVRLISVAGQAYGVTAGADGRFQASLPQTPGGSFYDVSMEERGRLMKAEGRLFVPPSVASEVPPKSVFMRMGASSLPLWPQAPLLAVLDYDAGGGLSVSGRASAGATVEVALDGRVAMRAEAGDNGIYSALIPLDASVIGQRLRVEVQSGRVSESRSVTFRPHTAGAGAAVLEDGLWYVHWGLSGGGTQTTIVF